jgi:flagellar basal body-associated protein FliL
MKVDINVLIAILGIAMCIATFFIGRSSAAKQQGTQEGVIATEIKHLRDDVTEIKGMMTSSNNKIEGRVNELSSQLSSALVAAATAQKSADEVCNRLMEHLNDHKNGVL